MAPSTGTTLLLVEDSPTDAAFVERMIVEYRSDAATGDHGHTASVDAVEQVDRLSDGIGRVADGDVDIVLLDLGLPDSNGLDTVTRMLEHAAGVPVVVLTGQKGMGVQAIQHGAQDYLVKGQITADVLVRTIAYAVERARITADLRDRTHRLKLINELLRTDLRDDVSMIVGRADQLHERVDGDDRDTVKAILDASNHALDVTDTAAAVIDVIDDDGTEGARTVDLRGVLETGVERVRNDLEASITVDDATKADSPLLVAGTSMLGSVFERLLTNAAGRTDGADPMVTVRLERTGNDVCVSVADGSEETSSTRARGPIGSGMATGEISAGIDAEWYMITTVVESVGGTVSVEDDPHRGTVVTARLDSADRR